MDRRVTQARVPSLEEHTRAHQMPRPLRIAPVVCARLDRAGYHPGYVALMAALFGTLATVGIHP
jgi:hypothetical protein